MKTNLRYLILCVLVLSSAICGAETVATSQNFDDMYNGRVPETLTVSNSNKTGTTDFVTYTCYGTKAEIFQDLFNPTGKKVIAINLENNGNYVTTTSIEGLKRLEIFCNSDKAKSYIKVFVSKDGSFSDPALSGDNISYGSTITANFPADTYYVKILNNTTSNKVSIIQIDYTCDHCNCRVYVPE